MSAKPAHPTHYPSWWRWLLVGEWRAHPARACMAILAIAIGVALGFAIHLMNAAAFNEFSAALKSVSGLADLQVRGAQPTVDEKIYSTLAQHPLVQLASPVLELDATLPEARGSLKVLGLDTFKAMELAPDLMPVPASDKPFDMLSEDAIFLSTAAQEWLKLKSGDKIVLRNGTKLVTLRVAGGLLKARAGQKIAVMDIAALQWRFDLVGKLSRVDVVLVAGSNRQAFKQEWQNSTAHGPLVVSETVDQEARTDNMSRAYRVNLTVLALVALFTGAFLVFSTQALSVLRRRSQFALLRVMGLTRGQLLRQVMLEGASLGVIGALLGIAGGYLLAALALRFFGGDLGAGYFSGVLPKIIFTPIAALVFFTLGLAVALLGCAAPAWEASRAHPAQALKAGGEDAALAKLSAAWPALTLLASAAVLTQLPAVADLPLFGYLAVACLLIGGILLMPRLTALLFGFLQKLSSAPSAPSVPSAKASNKMVLTLALARLANAPSQASIALGGVLASFSLMVAMGIMVASFRISVDDWLGRLLPYELYLRTSSIGEVGKIGVAQQKAIAAVAGIAEIDFQHKSYLLLAADRASVVLLAINLDPHNLGKKLPIIGQTLGSKVLPKNGELPIWISEAMVDLYGLQVGSELILPINGKRVPTVVAGIWRDYSRQTGTLAMRLQDYQRLTQDYDVSAGGIALRPGTQADAVIAAIRALPFGEGLEFSQAGEIRTMSMQMFDRSFAITYLLEAIAMLIGLSGVAATFSAQTLARAKEFGMLRHLGLQRREILRILLAEGTMLTAIGILVGFVLGFLISLILVFIVNPQSFHWSMQLHMPWGLLASVASAMLLAAGLTALLAGRAALAGSALHAVREDW